MGVPEDALKDDFGPHRRQHCKPADLEGPGIVPERHVIPAVAPPNVVVLAMFLTSLHVLENHLCGLVLDISSKDLARYFHLLLSMRSTRGNRQSMVMHMSNSHSSRDLA